MINHATIEGRLTSKPNVSTAQSGQQVAHFTLASDENYKNRQGQTPADFVSCVMFGSRNRQGQFTNRNIQALCQFVPKGGLISIEGKISQSRYQSRKTGQMVYSQPVTVLSFNFLNTHVRNHGGNNQYAQQGNNNQQPNNRFHQRPFTPNGNTNNQPQNNSNNMNTNGNNKQFPSAPNNNPAPNNPSQKNKKLKLSDDDLPF